MPEDVPEELEREVSATPAEFLHGLRNAFPDAIIENAFNFRVVTDAAAMTIQLTPGPNRAIAMLRLPTLKVRIRFTAGAADARAAMLRRMDLAMHRGGG